jgi:diguanylate cyclase (GGDEF)-like protein
MIPAESLPAGIGEKLSNFIEPLAQNSAVRPDVVVIDHQASSADLTIYKTAGAQIIMICRDAADRSKALTLNADEILLSPLDEIELSFRLRTLLEIKKYSAALNGLALSDPVTHLPNKRACLDHFDREFRRALRSQKPLGFILIALDQSESWKARDAQTIRVIMREAAVIIKRIFSRPGDMAYRYSSARIAGILPETPPDAIIKIAKEIVHVLEGSLSKYSIRPAAAFKTLMPGDDASFSTILIKKTEELLSMSYSTPDRIQY